MTLRRASRRERPSVRVACGRRTSPEGDVPEADIAMPQKVCVAVLEGDREGGDHGAWSVASLAGTRSSRSSVRGRRARLRGEGWSTVSSGAAPWRCTLRGTLRTQGGRAAGARREEGQVIGERERTTWPAAAVPRPERQAGACVRPEIYGAGRAGRAPGVSSADVHAHGPAGAGETGERGLRQARRGAGQERPRPNEQLRPPTSTRPRTAAGAALSP